MPEHPGSFAALLQIKILPNIQRAALLICVAGGALFMLRYQGAHQLLMIGFSSLAMAYFLMAFMPFHIRVGAKSDLYAAIVYKVIYIGCSVAAIGVLFQLLNFHGAEEMLVLGTVTTGVALLVAFALIARIKDNWIVLKEAIIRGATLLLLGIYMMRMASII